MKTEELERAAIKYAKDVVTNPDSPLAIKEYAITDFVSGAEWHEQQGYRWKDEDMVSFANWYMVQRSQKYMTVECGLKEWLKERKSNE